MSIITPLMQYVKNVEVIDYPGVAQQASAAQFITTAQARPKVWNFRMDCTTPILRWDQYRGLVEDIRAINMANPFSFDLQNLPNLNAQFAYMGTLTPAQVATVTVASQPGSGLVNLGLANLPENQTNVFRKGDYIQVGNAVRTVTADVNAVGTTATVPLSEPLRAYPSVGTSIAVGTDVVWNNCYFTDLPTPSLGYEWVNGIQWSGSFAFTQTRS